jgi:hypothetical protein
MRSILGWNLFATEVVWLEKKLSKNEVGEK